MPRTLWGWLAQAWCGWWGTRLGTDLFLLFLCVCCALGLLWNTLLAAGFLVEPVRGLCFGSHCVRYALGPATVPASCWQGPQPLDKGQGFSLGVALAPAVVGSWNCVSSKECVGESTQVCGRGNPQEEKLRTNSRKGQMEGEKNGWREQWASPLWVLLTALPLRITVLIFWKKSTHTKTNQSMG